MQEAQAGMQQIFERCEKGRQWRSLFLLGRPGSTKDNQMVQLPETFKGSVGRETNKADGMAAVSFVSTLWMEKKRGWV